jgi:hypothetical protein
MGVAADTRRNGTAAGRLRGHDDTRDDTVHHDTSRTHDKRLADDDECDHREPDQPDELGHRDADDDRHDGRPDELDTG